MIIPNKIDVMSPERLVKLDETVTNRNTKEFSFSHRQAGHMAVMADTMNRVLTEKADLVDYVSLTVNEYSSCLHIEFENTHTNDNEGEENNE